MNTNKWLIIVSMLLCLAVGYFIGREHVKYEIRSAAKEVLGVIEEGVMDFLAPLGASEEARRGLCEMDINSTRIALGLYEIDHASFPVAKKTIGWKTLRPMLKDPNGEWYLSLPKVLTESQGENFTDFRYYGIKDSYTITGRTKDTDRTRFEATPEGFYWK